MKKYLHILIVCSIVIGVFSTISLGQAIFPAVTHYEMPAIYPPAARAVLGEGEVVVWVEVNSEGAVTKSTAVSGHPLLRRISEMATEKWTFSPGEGSKYLSIRFLFHIRRNKEKVTDGIIGTYSVRFTNKFETITTSDPKKELIQINR